MRVVEAKSRVSVEPEYRLLVDADRVTLKGKLKYRIRAAENAVLGRGAAPDGNWTTAARTI